MKYLLTLCLLLPLQAFASNDYPWWATKTYAPKSTTLLDTPVSHIDKTWVAVEVFSRNTFTKKEQNDMTDSAEWAPTWEITRDFNRDGKMDKALVGVAKTSKGLKRFFVIMTKDGDVWKKSYLQTTPTSVKDHDPGFSYMVDKRKEIYWMPCFECDSDLGKYFWTGKKYDGKVIFDEEY